MRCFKLIIVLFVYSLSLHPLHAETAILKEIGGREISFKQLKGKWVFINYWASWCQPCLDEISELNQFYANNKDKVALFAVNYDMLPLAEQLALIQRYKIRYPSLQKDPSQVLELGDIRGVPATFIFNPEGELTETLYGGQSLAQFNAVIDG